MTQVSCYLAFISSIFNFFFYFPYFLSFLLSFLFLFSYPQNKILIKEVMFFLFLIDKRTKLGHRERRGRQIGAREERVVADVFERFRRELSIGHLQHRQDLDINQVARLAHCCLESAATPRVGRSNRTSRRRPC